MKLGFLTQQTLQEICTIAKVFLRQVQKKTAICRILRHFL